MTTGPNDPTRRARHALWILVGVAVLAAGSLEAAAVEPAGMLVGMWFSLSGLVLVGALVLAVRVSLALEQARRRRTGRR